MLDGFMLSWDTLVSQSIIGIHFCVVMRTVHNESVQGLYCGILYYLSLDLAGIAILLCRLRRLSICSSAGTLCS